MCVCLCIYVYTQTDTHRHTYTNIHVCVPVYERQMSILNRSVVEWKSWALSSCAASSRRAARPLSLPATHKPSIFSSGFKREIKRAITRHHRESLRASGCPERRASRTPTVYRWNGAQSIFLLLFLSAASLSGAGRPRRRVCIMKVFDLFFLAFLFLLQQAPRF